MRRLFESPLLQGVPDEVGGDEECWRRPAGGPRGGPCRMMTRPTRPVLSPTTSAPSSPALRCTALSSTAPFRELWPYSCPGRPQALRRAVIGVLGPLVDPRRAPSCGALGCRRAGLSKQSCSHVDYPASDPRGPAAPPPAAARAHRAAMGLSGSMGLPRSVGPRGVHAGRAPAPAILPPYAVSQPCAALPRLQWDREPCALHRDCGSAV